MVPTIFDDNMDDTQDIFPPTLPSRILDRTHGQHLQNTDHLSENPQALSRPHSQPRHSHSLGTSTLNETGQGSRPLGLYGILPTQVDTEHFTSINKAMIEHPEAYMRLNHANLQLEKENMHRRGEDGALWYASSFFFLNTHLLLGRIMQAFSKRSASPTTTFAKRHSTSPSPIPLSSKQKGRAPFDNPL